jgi:hypothetical protein
MSYQNLIIHEKIIFLFFINKKKKIIQIIQINWWISFENEN